MWGLFPPLGAAAAWFLTLLADWLVELPWVPYQGAIELVASLPEPYATMGALVIGALAGLLLAFIGHLETLTVTVSGDRVTTKRRDGTEQAVERAGVTDVFVDGKKLVVLGSGGEELLRETSDLKTDRLAEAFARHGYPWRADGDPYAEDFRRWVEDMPGLPAGANELLKARERALRKGDDHDIVELRTELARLGVVVREEKKRQYWRLTTS